MKKFYNPKATICAGDNCITVYDEVAEAINGIAVITFTVLLISVIHKALK